MESIWRIQAPSPQRAEALARSAGIHPLTAQVLLNRGIEDAQAAERFLHPSLRSLGDPTELSGMERAVGRINRAMAKREPILIFGDSDVDGLTASVILYEALRDRGAMVRARQSNRLADGYGLPGAFVQRLCRSSIRLVILVDCGTNQPDAVRQLAAHGIDTIIVDHHVPLDQAAHPCALINPHCDSSTSHRELSSAGLAFQVVRALFADLAREQLEASLDLAALGTLADCSPLLNASRVIVAEGLPRIIGSDRPGLRRLCASTDTTQPDPEQIVRRLVPRLNASGRLGDPAAVWHLLGREMDHRMDEWLAQADASHETTKRFHRQIMAEAREQVNRLHFRDQFVMVISGNGWHQGLMGPLASQLAAQYARPAIAIAMEANRGTGSGRSTPLFNLLEALKACQEFLVKFGGHAYACGLTVDRKNVERLRAGINQQARSLLGRQGLLRTRTVDLELSLDAIQPGWVAETERFAPFGQSNPRPSVVIRNLAIDVTSPRMAVCSDGTTCVAAKGRFHAVVQGGRYDVVATPAVVNGELVLLVSDVKATAAPWERARTSNTPYTRAPA